MWDNRLAISLSLLSLFYKVYAHGVKSSITAINDHDSDTEHWNLSEKPNLNDTTSNFIFETANSLLQHWPNTRYRNGHTLVPAIIPSGTLLYHGTTSPTIPNVPEWLAMDPEHSYLYCGRDPYPPANVSNGKTTSASEEGCWHLTFVTTRPLKLLYFDGNSAAKLSDGPLDSQDLLTWGGIRGDLVNKERERIDKLCQWGTNYSLDGFIRMEQDFEVMLCNFTMSLDRVTSLKIHMSIRPKPSWPGVPSKVLPPHIRALEAGSWSNRFPGDHRIKVDYSRLISFYDRDSFPSLHLQRVGQARWDHRLKGISNAELDGLLLRLEEVFTEQESESDIDWKALLHVVTNRYGDRLELLQYLLENATTSSEADQEAALWKAHRFVSSMLTPYILYESGPPEISTRNDHDWAAPVFKYCASTHIQYLEMSLFGNLTTSERLLFNAVREVSKEICRVLVLIWAEGRELSTKPRSPEEPKLAAQHSEKGIQGYGEESRRNLLMRWKSSVLDLMTWLDWSVWVRCRPECSYNEMCYLPTWPYFFHRNSGDEKNWNKPMCSLSTWPRCGDGEDSERPQPVCIPRLEPYDL